MTDPTSAAVDVKRAAAAPSPRAPSGRGRDVFDTLRTEIDRLFDDVIWPGVGWGGRRLARVSPTLADQAADWLPGLPHVPAMDLVERDGEYALSVDLPGLAPEQIDLRLHDGMLSLKAEKTLETSGEEGDFRVQERCSGVLARTMSLPPGVDLDKVEASYANGVLLLHLPKTSEARAKERRIAVQAA